MNELIAIGPIGIKLKLAEDVRGTRIQCLVSDHKPSLAFDGGWATFQLPSILDHEVVIIS
jgi:hypothetical protein